jgi:hypothetical protein
LADITASVASFPLITAPEEISALLMVLATNESDAILLKLL